MNFKVGDYVMLKDSYKGYFRDFKGILLTVTKIIPKDDSISETCIQVNEIDEGHLLGISNFTKASYWLIVTLNITWIKP